MMSTSLLLYNIGASIISGICSAILYFTMVIYSVLSLIVAWSLYFLENLILLLLFILQTLFNGITGFYTSLGSFLQFVGSKFSATNTTMTDILQDFSSASISATVAMSRLIALTLEYLLVIGVSLFVFVFLLGCMYHVLTVVYIVWRRSEAVKREIAQRRRNNAAAARNNGNQAGVVMARHGNGVRRRGNIQQRRDLAVDRRGIQRRIHAGDRHLRVNNRSDVSHSYSSTAGLNDIGSAMQTLPLHQQEPSLRRTDSGKVTEVDIQTKLNELELQLMREVESKQCVVCLDLPRRVMIRPCNHYCVCEPCGRKLRKCPVCTRGITRIEKVFES